MDAQVLIAKRIARELRDGMLVNLGIGIPTLVSNYVAPGIRIFFQSENGLIGTGPIPAEGLAQARLTDAAGRPVAIPADRVVRPDQAPPGLPLRRVVIPSALAPDKQ
mgnify:CR=1 FL=1